MPKRKNTYKQYLFNSNVQIPISTKHYHKKLANQRDVSSTNSKLNNDINKDLRNQAENHSQVDIEQTLTNNLNEVNHICDNRSRGVDQNDDQSNELILQPNLSNELGGAYIDDVDHFGETNSEFDSDGYQSSLSESEEDANYDLSILNMQDKNIGLKEMAAAFLAAFYSGKITQKALSDFIKLHNIYSSNKLPSNFDGLAKILVDKDANLSYKKTWFCNICIKSFEELNHRFQRECHICSSKYSSLTNYVIKLLIYICVSI